MCGGGCCLAKPVWITLQSWWMLMFPESRWSGLITLSVRSRNFFGFFFFFPVKVFNVASSCVRVELDGIKEVYNSGQTFMTPCGKKQKYNDVFFIFIDGLVNLSSRLFPRAILQHSQHVPGACYFVVPQDVTKSHNELTWRKHHCRKSCPFVQVFVYGFDKTKILIL